MVFAVVFFLNFAANLGIGLTLSALLGPAEFGRYATIALAAMTLATALFDWLRLSSLRFSGDVEGRARVAASLDAGFLAMMAVAVLVVAVGALAGFRFGFGLTLLATVIYQLIGLINRQTALDLFGAAVSERMFLNARSMRGFLNTPDGAIYGFAPLPPERGIWAGMPRSPRRPIAGLYLASSFAGSGGFTGANQAGAQAASLAVTAPGRGGMSYRGSAKLFRRFPNFSKEIPRKFQAFPRRNLT